MTKNNVVLLILIIIVFGSCNNKNKVKIIESVDDKTKNIVLDYIYSDVIADNNCNHNYTVVYDSTRKIMKYKSFYLGDDIYKYVNYDKNRNISSINYSLWIKNKPILYQWIFIENDKLDLKRSEFTYTYIDKNKENNEYYLGIIYYTPLYPERKYIKIGYGDHFAENINNKIDTYYFDKEQILTKKYMPYHIPCFFYKEIKLNRKDMENGVIRGKIESYVYHGDNPKTGDSAFLLYTKYFANKITTEK